MTMAAKSAAREFNNKTKGKKSDKHLYFSMGEQTDKNIKGKQPAASTHRHTERLTGLIQKICRSKVNRQTEIAISILRTTIACLRFCI